MVFIIAAKNSKHMLALRKRLDKGTVISVPSNKT